MTRRAAQQPHCTYDAKQTAREALAPVVRARYKKLQRDVKRLSKDPPDEALHAVRIRAKRCRYACEASVAAFGKPASHLADALAKVQDVLGEHQDAVVAIGWLSKTAHECSPTEAFAIGMLAQVEREAARVSRAAFPATWKRARKWHLRAWLWSGA
jgi:CHAD domain-containing protein